MKYICVQPRLVYFAWQVEVMINNFIYNGISGNDIEVLVAYNNNDDTSSESNREVWEKLINKYNYVRFFQYEDKREDMSYIPSIYFNIIKQHYLQFPELEKQPVFIHDCDILFTKKLNFNHLLQDNIWYLSDTVGYIGTQYILTKGEDVYKGMCNVINIDPLIPKLMNSNSGGAQHIIKNATYEYWDKVEKDSVKLYRHFCETEPHYKGQGHPIQKWTAGMWALLWNAWLFSNETKVVKELDFCWATDPISRWEECSIFHNAGVTKGSNGMFFKGAYTYSAPNNIKLQDFNPNLCSYNYVKEILNVKDKSTIFA